MPCLGLGMRIAIPPAGGSLRVTVNGLSDGLQWSMCGLTLSARDAEVLASAEQAFNFDLRAGSPKSLVRFLVAMSRRYNDQVGRLYDTPRVV